MTSYSKLPEVDYPKKFCYSLSKASLFWFLLSPIHNQYRIYLTERRQFKILQLDFTRQRLKIGFAP